MPLTLKIAKGILFALAPIVIITSFLFFNRIRHIRAEFILSRKRSELEKIVNSANANMQNSNFNPFIDLSFGRRVEDESNKKEKERVNEVEVGVKTGEVDDKYSYLDQGFVKSDTFKRIISLSREQLDKIAKKLSIFAYRKLATEELLKRILLIYEEE